MGTAEKTIVGFVRDLVEADDVRGLSDGKLLRRFAKDQDDRAFAAILRRHASAVWGVCRHLLGAEQDAEDAFQATFLVLARRATSIRQTESLGSWLHGVAYRVAVRARQSARLRQERERATARPTTVPADQAWHDLQAALDEAVMRLPEKYRGPFLLCCMEGKTRAEVAAELGCREGTLSSRIARARDLLRQHLTRRGMTLSAALVAGFLWRQSAAAAVPALLAATVHVVGSKAGGAGVSAAVLALADKIGAVATTRWLLAAAFLVGFGVLVAAAGSGRRGSEAHRAAPPAAGARTEKQGPERKATERVRTDLFGDPLPPGALARVGTVRFAHGDAMIEHPALAPDHKTFATISIHSPYRKGRVVGLWDAESGKELRHLHDPDYEHYQAFFLKTENLLGTVGISLKPVRGAEDAHAIQWWNPRTGEKVGPAIRAVGYPFEPLALSADERWLASASREPPVLVRERKTGRVVATWKGIDRVNGLAFAPDGKTLAIACGRSLHLWDWKAGRETGRLDDLPESMWALRFSPDGKWLAATVYTEGVRLWKAKDLIEVRRLPGEQDIRFFPDGKRLISAATGVVRDVMSGKEVGRFERCAHCLALEFSADGKVATGYALGRIRRWDAATGKDRSPPVRSFHQIMIHQIGFLPAGKAIVSASPDGTVRLWDAATGKELRTLVRGTTRDANRPTFMRVGPDGTVVVARGDRLSFFKGDEQSREVTLTAFPGAGLASLNVSPDGKHLIVAGQRDGKSLVQLWDLPARKPVGKFTPPEGTQIESLAVFREGAVAACVGDAVCILNGRTGAVERTLERRHPDPPNPPGKLSGGDRGHSWFHGIQALTFSPDGDILACGGYPSGGLKLLDVASGKTRHALLPAAAYGHYELHHVVFSPDGRMVASESAPGVVDVWEVSTGRRRRCFQGHRSYQTTLAFSPNGTQLASGNRDATILVWDVFGLSTGRPTNPPREAELAALWTGLIDADAERACLAMGNLMRYPDASVPFLGRHLLGRKDTNSAQIKGWIVDLDCDVFFRRERASRNLAKHLPAAAPLLREALAAKPSLEARLRIERLLLAAGLQHPSPTTLRDLRAVEVLEHSRSPAAREVLRKLSGGDYDFWVASAARAAARRLAAMPR